MPRRNYFVILCAIVVGVVCYQSADRNPLARSFSEITDLVERRYVDQVDRQKLWAGAVRGMLNELSDPYSEYIDPKEAAELETQLNQEFAGIGIQVALDPGSNKLTIISPIVGTPAYRAGILAGDTIAKIDGHPTREMNYTEATARIRGKEGDPVQLTIERPGHSEPIDLPPIKREMINVESVLGDTRTSHDDWNFLLQTQPKIGYVRIISFGEHTVAELKAALEQLEKEHVQGLVLDLRNDPGGLLTAAIDVCNMFLPEGTPIVSTRGRDGNDEQKHVADGGWKFPNVPMVVLVNHGSASASEIVAACLQDNGRAAVAGERSYGKGTVQNV
ncbi:MAG TPA: S41 family peptidase, partial [Pirellulales bacterium]